MTALLLAPDVASVGWATLVLLGLAVAAGAFVQASIGFGLAVVSAPIILLVAPQLMPGALLVCGITLPVIQLTRGERDVDWRMFGFAMITRLITTPLGVVIVALWSTKAISLLVAGLILVTVGLSISKLRLASSPRNAALAGSVSGISGTAAAIGGPFLAIVMAGDRPSKVRATLSMFFLAGTVVSLLSLLGAGELHRQELIAPLIWIPFLVLGFAASAPVRARLDQARLRILVLGFCVIAAASVVVRALAT